MTTVLPSIPLTPTRAPRPCHLRALARGLRSPALAPILAATITSLLAAHAQAITIQFDPGPVGSILTKVDRSFRIDLQDLVENLLQARPSPAPVAAHATRTSS